MPNILCDQRIRCPGTDFPITNFSSEATDGFEYLGLAFPFWEFPINKWYDTRFCSFFVCLSPVSQEEADLCAQREAQTYCPPDPPDSEPDIPSDPLFANTTQAATSRCPDGTIFTYIVPAGRFIAESQALANARAWSYAYRSAQQSRVCLSNIDGNCCVSSSFSRTITATGRFGPFAFTITAGALPAGLILTTTAADRCRISGTPTAEGQFDFYLRATDVRGNFMQKHYTLCVVKESPATLPAGIVGATYNQTLTATSCAVAPLSWQISSGALPTGLTLNESTGVISGTPTVQGTFNFTVKLQTEAT